MRLNLKPCCKGHAIEITRATVGVKPIGEAQKPLITISCGNNFCWNQVRGHDEYYVNQAWIELTKEGAERE